MPFPPLKESNVWNKKNSVTDIKKNFHTLGAFHTFQWMLNKNRTCTITSNFSEILEKGLSLSFTTVNKSTE